MEVAGFAQVIEKMERETGLEPATSTLENIYPKLDRWWRPQRV
jgi:hypothetical protein